MDSFRFCALPSVLFLVALTFSPAGELQLVLRDATPPQTLAGIQDDRLMLRADDRVAPAPSDAQWKLEGDLKASASQLCWDVPYGIIRYSGPDHAQDPERPFIGTVSFSHRTSPQPGGKPEPSWLLQRWPNGLPDGGVAAFAWIVGSRVRHLELRRVPRVTTDNNTSGSVGFPLTAEEAEHGRGVLGMWTDGGFVGPRLPPEAEPAPAAYFAVVFDEPAQLGQVSSETASYLVRQAVRMNSIRCLRALLDTHPATAHSTDAWGRSLLHEAASNGRVAAVYALLDAGTSASARDKQKTTPIHVAAVRGHTEVIQALINAGARPQTKDMRDRTPIADAIDEGFANAAELLLRSGATIPNDHDQKSRVLYSQAYGGHTGIVRLLLAQGANPNLDVRGQHALLAAARHDDPELVDVLLAAKAAINRPDAQGRTALMLACMRDHAAFAGRLLDRDADVKARDKIGRTALHFSAMVGALRSCELLVGRGADLAIADKAGLTALDLAVLAQAPNVARLLLSRGAVVAVDRPHSAVTLQAAIALDLDDYVTAALRQGWSPLTPFQNTWTAHRIAELCGSARSQAVLEAAGATPADPKNVLPVVTQLDQPLRLIAQTVPVDPRTADDEFPAQQVVVDCIVDQEGFVRFPRIRETPDPRLGFAVMLALEQWRFAPPVTNGQPALARVRIPVRFPSSKERAFELTEVDEFPKAVKTVRPVYPKNLMLAGSGGRVVLAFTVNEEGRPEDVRPVETSNPGLNDAAATALRKWTFTPGKRDGKPVRVRMQLPIVFRVR